MVDVICLETFDQIVSLYNMVVGGKHLKSRGEGERIKVRIDTLMVGRCERNFKQKLAKNEWEREDKERSEEQLRLKGLFQSFPG